MRCIGLSRLRALKEEMSMFNRLRGRGSGNLMTLKALVGSSNELVA